MCDRWWAHVSPAGATVAGRTDRTRFPALIGSLSHPVSSVRQMKIMSAVRHCHVFTYCMFGIIKRQDLVISINLVISRTLDLLICPDSYFYQFLAMKSNQYQIPVLLYYDIKYTRYTRLDYQPGKLNSAKPGVHIVSVAFGNLFNLHLYCNSTQAFFLAHLFATHTLAKSWDENPNWPRF